jgi:hypothetical protein
MRQLRGGQAEGDHEGQVEQQFQRCCRPMRLMRIASLHALGMMMQVFRRWSRHAAHAGPFAMICHDSREGAAVASIGSYNNWISETVAFAERSPHPALRATFSPRGEEGAGLIGVIHYGQKIPI